MFLSSFAFQSTLFGQEMIKKEDNHAVGYRTVHLIKLKSVDDENGIVTIADVYDSLTSTRPYKEAYSHRESLKIIASEEEKFDPEIYKIFYENADEFYKIRKDIKNRNQEK